VASLPLWQRAQEINPHDQRFVGCADLFPASWLQDTCCRSLQPRCSLYLPLLSRSIPSTTAARTRSSILANLPCISVADMRTIRTQLILDSEAVPPQENRDSRFRPASSIYSQPSPNPINTRFPQNSFQTPSYTEEEEVSPQSSPELGPVKNRYVEPSTDIPRVCP